ncbi:hypothetical protein UlMin_042727 [Ulmus minor]
MPSVGMRRTTRVFGVVKGADGARVLRSGRRLWPESGETKLRRANDGDDWLKIVNGGKGDGGLGYEPKGWSHHDSPKKNRALAAVEVYKPIEKAGLDNGRVSDKRFGLVYTRRKRKSSQEKISDFPANSEAKDGSEKMYGRQFVRRQRRKISSGEYLAVAENVELKVDYWPRRVVTVVVESSLARRFWTARFLISVLMYMTRSRLRLTELFSFLSSEPICSVNSSFGILCFLDHHSNKSSGICKFFGAMKFVPLFRVDFSAIPTCFVDLHSSMFFRFKCQPNLLVNNTSDDVMVDDDEVDWPLLPNDEVLKCRALMNTESSHTENRGVSQSPIRPSKLGSRSNQYRNGLISRGFQKRRSSLRRRRARNPLPNGVHKSNGALVSDLVSFRKNGASSNKLRRSVRSSSAGHLKEASLAEVRVKQDVDSSDCCANMLVIESEKCYREELVNVMLELSPLGEWLLVVKKDGSTRYTHKAEKVMRPCCSNRFTHAIIWTGDNGWKLEFPNRKDWIVFKDLYKECSDRNVPTPGVKIIPVPAVSEVSENGHNHSSPFCRPDSYISVKDDEVSRAMAKRTANYDMDSEDEEWLKKFNSEFFAETEILEHISADRFELMFDSFEKAFYCSSIDMSDEKPAPTLCPNVSRRDVVEAIYGYWTKKRKQKRSSLLRVFQAHQVKRAPLIPKTFLRKKRSFKRQPSQIGRGKQPSFLQAFAAEKDTEEEQNSLLKVVEAKSSANKFTELAVCKRRQAQLLMQNADLATYKATMALKIAEVASLPDTNSADAASDILD